WRNAPDVDRSALRLKRTTEMRQRAAVAQIGVAAGIQAQMVKALVNRQPAEILDNPNGAPGNIGAQLLECDDRTFAPSIADRIGDLGPAAGGSGDTGQQAGPPDQIADIWHGPGRAGFDELIVIESAEVLLEYADLFGNDGEERLQRLAGRCVACLVDRRQQRVDFFGAERHCHCSSWFSKSGSMSSSSAPATAVRSPASG